MTKQNFTKITKDIAKYNTMSEYSNFISLYSDSLNFSVSEKQQSASNYIDGVETILANEIQKTQDEINTVNSDITSYQSQYDNLTTQYNQAIWDEAHPPEPVKPTKP